ncbi:caffeic acid 3-O-methyltransferase [Phalaenopsis equestris]|uniref:caffeic acid 3-O-methyltransferase n=1 Tax=Phalaenopsis equestris TaxID=78828 RepID=UPI0009E25FDF|nr:caffeic acid 3-O-methyltransferase [Phalaenopsis equestris]
MAATGGEIKKSARLAMMEISNMLSVPMALNAIVRLNVPEAIWQSGSNSPLTAAEILARLNPPPPSSASPSNLQRLLRLLSSHNVFSEHLDGGHRRYNLTEIGRTLVADDDEANGGVSYAPYVLQHHQDALVRAWPRLHEAILDPDGPEPFSRANGGVSAYAYYGGDDAANDLMRRAMWGVSVPFMEAFLDEYGLAGGLEGVGTIVDVGGSSGACLQMIMRRFPAVKTGINFDLPEVVSGAPEFPGIIHVGGDMFKSIPSGDAIFMKWVLTTWTDEECGLILKNCYNALPAGGKLIACEPVLPEETDSSRRTRALLEGDIFVMTIYRSQGKERTEEEFKQLGCSAGFPNFRALYFDPFYTVLEFQK